MDGREQVPLLGPRELCIAEVLDFDGLPVVRFMGTPQNVADAAALYAHNMENPLGGFAEDIPLGSEGEGTP